MKLKELQLKDYRDADVWLTEALECDPTVMKDLGGPTLKEKIPALHARRLQDALSNRIWYYTIVPDPSTGPIGTIGVWPSEFEGVPIKEMGWMLLPAFHGRGIATAAGKLLLARVKSDEHFEQIYAFPAVSNGASNAICRKLGFELIREVAIGYNGPPLTSNLWKLTI